MTADRSAIPTVPVGLRVDGRLVVIVGAGRIAARKATAYLDRGAALRIVALEHGPEMLALGRGAGVDGGEAPPIERIVGPYRSSHLDGAWLVVTATGRPEVDGEVFGDAEGRRLWCNAADDPDRCSIILPAVVRRGPITVGIGTGGTSPAMASWLGRRTAEFVERQLLSEPMLAASEVMAGVRTELRATGRPTEVEGWRQALDDFEVRLRALLDVRPGPVGPDR